MKTGTKEYAPDKLWRAHEYDRLGMDHAPCRWCGWPALAYPKRPDETQCDGCWETTSRLSSFIALGPEARAFVQEALS